MARRSGRPTVALVALALVGTFGAHARPPVVSAATSPFTDIAGTTFEADIEWLLSEGVTVGCTPTAYCPDVPVTRGQMASFLVRMFDLTEGGEIDTFTDDDGTTHEQDINRLAASGITSGCTATKFCPRALVRRDEMASFLVRAIPLTIGAGDDYFRDDDGTTHAADIDRAAAAGITTGCGTWRYCIAAPVTRGQMAGFLHRVVKPVTPPPHPAPHGPLYVETSGSDVTNDCRTEASPCRTVRRAIVMSFDGDSVEIGPGTYAEEDLTLDHDLTIHGDAGGGTIIDASGGGRARIFTVDPGRTVSLDRLSLTGGRATDGGAISNHGALSIANATIAGNTASGNGGGIQNFDVLKVTDSTITDNTAGQGGAIHGVSPGTMSITGTTIGGNVADSGLGGGIVSAGKLTITDSTISDNVATGIEFSGGALTIVGSTIDGNGAGPYVGYGVNLGPGGGDAVVADSSIGWNDGPGILAQNFSDWTVTIDASTIHHNAGGIVGTGDVTITNSTIHANTSSGFGGGVGMGGPLTITNSTITGNTAWFGGGIYFGDTLTVINSTISGNTAEEDGGGIFGDYDQDGRVLRVANTVVSGNTSGGGGDVSCNDANYDRVVCVFTTKLASIVGIPAGLTLADILDPAGLADNGGPTQTIALTDSATNPALDHGDAATCAAAPVSGLDQRGLPRTPPCDIGAYEFQP